MSRKRYFIAVTYVYEGLTSGKEACHCLSMNAGDRWLLYLFLHGFPLLRKQNYGDSGMF